MAIPVELRSRISGRCDCPRVRVTYQHRPKDNKITRPSPNARLVNRSRRSSDLAINAWIGACVTDEDLLSFRRSGSAEGGVSGSVGMPVRVEDRSPFAFSLEGTFGEQVATVSGSVRQGDAPVCSRFGGGGGFRTGHRAGPAAQCWGRGKNRDVPAQRCFL